VADITTPVELTVDQEATEGPDFGRISFRARNYAHERVPFARLLVSATARSAGSESGTLKLQTRRAGVVTDELLAADGLVVGYAAGGAKGVGTINASAYYRDGVALPQPKIFRSSLLTISNGAHYTAIVGHGLNAKPDIIQARLVARTYAEFGYDPGDEATFWSSTNALSLWANEGAIGINLDGDFKVRHKFNDSSHTATPASWGLILIALKI
jgi:hypothetical protein